MHLTSYHLANNMCKVRVMRISEEQLLKSGFSPDSVRFPEEYGGGFMASLEVNHQLHCLVSTNLLPLVKFLPINGEALEFPQKSTAS